MKIYISSFYNVRFFSENVIPVSTAASHGWPWWLYKADNQKLGEAYINSKNVLIGITDSDFVFPGNAFEELTEQCQKECPYKSKAPNCQFMIAYYNYLKTLDFKAVMNKLELIVKDVREATNFTGEPEIVLMVYESPKSNCGERIGLQKYFKDNGIELEEWSKEK